MIHGALQKRKPEMQQCVRMSHKNGRKNACETAGSGAPEHKKETPHREGDCELARLDREKRDGEEGNDETQSSAGLTEQEC